MTSYGSLCTWIAIILTILSISLDNEVNASDKYSKNAYGSRDDDSRSSSSNERGWNSNKNYIVGPHGFSHLSSNSQQNKNAQNSAGSSKYSSPSGASRYAPHYTGFSGGSMWRSGEDPSKNSGSKYVKTYTGFNGGSMEQKEKKYSIFDRQDNSRGSDESSNSRPWG
ncbi:uncharacterized protein LOC122502585 [Leptopilina heterotoma]|uniref:uncharacterized protein LOC122502585 n=1 Tax=Leptopilina heterotoma TaxID=63436 RepID=UPI001CAA11E1|nr:uncharacterized protein LOC122502585 [Leptopilina heterotoma]